MNLNFLSNTPKDTVFKNTSEFLKRENLKINKQDPERPWGGFFVIEENESKRFIEIFFPNLSWENLSNAGRLSPKILIVAPEKRLSWQYHHRRKEIWKLIGGSASVVKSDTDEEKELKKLEVGEIVQLKQGERHRLVGTDMWGIVAEIWMHTDAENPSNEDDIIRLQDDFGR